jgi:hypothetical protein
VRSLLSLALVAGFVSACPAAAPPPEPPKLVRPVVSWSALNVYYDGGSGVKDYLEVDLLTERKEFAQAWKYLAQPQPMPEVNFDEYFVVVVRKPLGLRFSSGGLAVDRRGQARLLTGFPEHPDNRAGRTHSSSIGIFPRAGITTVNGKKLPAP